MSDPSSRAVESKQRLWPISLWITILLVVAAACGIMSVYQRNAGQKEFVRGVARSELVAHHWMRLEPDTEFQSVITTMLDAVNPEQDGRDRSVRFIRSSASSATPLDPFETSAVQTIERGTDEVWQESWRGVTRYAHAIRAKPVCLSCHPIAPNGRTAKVDDVIGVISIEFGVSANRPGVPVAITSAPAGGAN